MTALLTEIKSGDEVILPSYTFVSTANAIAFKRAILGLLILMLDTLNIDPSKLGKFFTSKLK